MARPLVLPFLLVACLVVATHATSVPVFLKGKSLESEYNPKNLEPQCHQGTYSGSLKHKNEFIAYNTHDIRHITLHVLEDCSASFIIGDGGHNPVYKGKIARIWDLKYGMSNMNGQRVYVKMVYPEDKNRLFHLQFSLYGQDPDITYAMDTLAM
jgi:hypothetical protein